jgi:hypothetical protein
MMMAATQAIQLEAVVTEPVLALSVISCVD